MNRKTGVILSFIYMGFEVLVTLFLTPFIIRTLGDGEYGVYKLSESVTSYLLLLDLGVGQTVVRYVSKFRVGDKNKEIRQFTGFTTILYGIIGIITFLVGIVLVQLTPMVFAKGLSVEEVIKMEKLLQITTLNAAVTLGTTGFSNIIVAYERFAFSKGISIIQIILRSGLIVVALKNGWGSVGIASSQLFLTIVSRLVMIFYVVFRLHIVPVFNKIDTIFVKEVVAYSGWMFIMMLTTQINRYVDQIILGAFVKASSTIIAVYGMGLQLEYYFDHVGYAMNNVLMPGVVKMVENGASSEALCDEMVRIGRYVLTVLSFVWGAVLVCGRDFYVLWLGEGYHSSYIVAVILMSVNMLGMTQGVGDYILNAKNEVKECAILDSVVVILNLVISIILVQWKPMIGVLIGTFFSSLFCQVIIKNILYVKKIGIDIKDYYKRLLSGILPCVAITICFGIVVSSVVFIKGWIRIGLIVVLMAGLYFLLLWNFGINNKEKKYYKQLLKSIYKKVTR